MAQTSAAIDALVKQLALEPAARTDVQARAARYSRDCGCALGGVFMVASLLSALDYIAVTASLAAGVVGVVGVVGAGIAFVAACSMLGKLVGLLLASLRLELLRRSLSRRARRQTGGNRVHMH